MWPFLALVFGLLAGRIANFLIDRLPGNEPVFRKVGRCRRCGAFPSPLHLIPIVGWFQREGKCATCRLEISLLEPVVEAACATLWLLIALLREPSPRSIGTMIFVAALLTLGVIDALHRLLPDVLTLPSTALFVAATLIPGWPVSLRESALSAAIGYFAMMALAKAAALYYGEEALGQGDWKLVALLGAFQGAWKLAITVLVANVTGAVGGLLLVARSRDARRQKLPLGTFLAAAGIFMVFV